jgi:hypothetical protein
MQTKLKSAAAPKRSRDSDETRELVLLEEFVRHKSVAALAGAIADRLGRATRAEDLIARATLEPPHGEMRGH